jgi:nondiscriminating glutamyl-tRNA synthetase
MADPTIVRFAPSPTGPPHLGSLRTALFNWLLARATGGRLILRIEDTDQARTVPGAEDQMVEALRWLGIDWDEGPDVGGPNAPYHQSERLERYHEAADTLVAAGAAFRPPEEPGVIRLHTPHGSQIAFDDALRGSIEFEGARLPADPVLIKSDGFPTYHLASVVDDHMMAITHVIRGEEWIPSTPLHLLIYDALSWAPPIYVHLPLVTDREGHKLKKRDPRANALMYREMGYLPQAMVNYLALLGWHPGGEQEVFSPGEIVAHFSLDRLSRSPAAYDEERLRYFNRQHMARLSDAGLAALILPRIEDAYPAAVDRSAAWLERLAATLRDDLTTLQDAVPAAAFAFEIPSLDEEAAAVLRGEQAEPVLTALGEMLLEADTLDEAASKALFRELRARFKESHGWGGRAVMFPARAALTGTTRGPHLSEVAALLGRDESLRRVERALSVL